jgi:hypothetical protein
MDRQFPNLADEGFAQTSSASSHYNCIAWAAGDADRWWWPDGNLISYWPTPAPRLETLAAFQTAFASLGFEICDNGHVEAGFEKIAIYTRDDKPTHTARQLEDGRWTSKLGSNVDITHTLKGLEGPAYGAIAAFMKRIR